MTAPRDVVTFDCYGTLIDWESGIREAFAAEARRVGAPVDAPFAAGIRPIRSPRASVKAPLTWPNSSDSNRFSATAPRWIVSCAMALNAPVPLHGR